MPVASKGRISKLLTIQGKPIRSADFSKHKDAWPGDEPIEELLAKLD